MATEKIFNQTGGVIDGALTTYKTVIDCTDGLATGDYSTKIKLPAGAVVFGGFIANQADDLASGGSATLRLKVGSTSLGTAAADKAAVKGTIVYQPAVTDVGTSPEADTVPTPIVVTEDTALKVTVGTAALTAGVVEVGVIALVL